MSQGQPTEIEVDDVGVCRPLTGWHWERIRHMAPGPNKAIAPAAFSVGLTIRQFKRLPVEKQREVFSALQRLTAPPIPAVNPEASRRRIPRKGEHVPEARMVELGRELIAIKARLPRGHWLPWVREKSGLTECAVVRFMRAAKAADHHEHND